MDMYRERAVALRRKMRRVANEGDWLIIVLRHQLDRAGDLLERIEIIRVARRQRPANEA